MLWIGESLASIDRIYSMDDVIKEVDRIQREDIREVARRIFSDNNFHLSLVGPVKGLEDKIRNELSLG